MQCRYNDQITIRIDDQYTWLDLYLFKHLLVQLSEHLPTTGEKTITNTTKMKESLQNKQPTHVSR